MSRPRASNGAYATRWRSDPKLTCSGDANAAGHRLSSAAERAAAVSGGGACLRGAPPDVGRVGLRLPPVARRFRADRPQPLFAGDDRLFRLDLPGGPLAGGAQPDPGLMLLPAQQLQLARQLEAALLHPLRLHAAALLDGLALLHRPALLQRPGAAGGPPGGRWLGHPARPAPATRAPCLVSYR